MTWLRDHYTIARDTDQLGGGERHADTLALGLVGEIGSVLAECKKNLREAEAYPRHRNRLIEEFGDVLWYLLRIVDVLDCGLVVLDRLLVPTPSKVRDLIEDAMALGIAAGHLLRVMREHKSTAECRVAVERVTDALSNIVAGADVKWIDIVKLNRDKVLSRWPSEKAAKRVAEVTDLEEERFPERLCVEFRQTRRGGKDVVILRCRGLNFGDRLTDNITDKDYYRFHDVFHFSYGVLLGWSPVLRDLLRCKRRSMADVDENQDGARAQIIEEAVSALIFSHAKEMNFYEDVSRVEYGLLKSISELVRGYEVDNVPLYHWEEAILEGYRVFRELRCHHGGLVELNFVGRELVYRGKH